MYQIPSRRAELVRCYQAATNSANFDVTHWPLGAIYLEFLNGCFHEA